MNPIGEQVNAVVVERQLQSRNDQAIGCGHLAAPLDQPADLDGIERVVMFGHEHALDAMPARRRGNLAKVGRTVV
jgi:hypothetical protein